jgi:hypothetical protein
MVTTLSAAITIAVCVALLWFARNAMPASVRT